jgi:uncharacterized protein
MSATPSNPTSTSPAATAGSDATKPDPQAVRLARARSSLRQTINQYTALLRVAKERPSGTPIVAELRQDLETLSTSLAKLEEPVARIAVFGLVSRGKSAVLNALVGQKVLTTGPLNGVTTKPVALRWPVAAPHGLQVELIDTPGLDEIEGQTRAAMAEAIARQSDLILFVVSGDITRTEYEALCDLRRSQKPLLLVFNKIDLYPEQSRQAVYQNLQQLAGQGGAAATANTALQQLLSANEIVLVAADPVPLQVRVEYADGRVEYEWETPPTLIEDLQRKILEILQREGQTLLALNALVQSREADRAIAQQSMALRQAEAEALIGQFMRYKALAIALNPIAVLDVIGGAVADIALIRALSDLYGLPITRYEASKLWRTIVLSSGGLLASELGSGLLLGLGKSAAAVGAGLEGNPFTYVGTAAMQGAIAGYGTYAVGQAIQTYLENGCSWGPQGANTVITEILDQMEPNTIIYRLRQELSRDLGLPLG